MYNDETKRELENIIRGSLIEGDPDHCTAVRNFLCAGFSTSTTVKRDFESKLLTKKEQESDLRQYATDNPTGLSVRISWRQSSCAERRLVSTNSQPLRSNSPAVML